MSSTNQMTKNIPQSTSTSLDKNNSVSAIPSSKRASRKPNQRYNLRLSTRNYVPARSWKHRAPKDADDSAILDYIASVGSISSRRVKQKRIRRAKKAAEAQKSQPESCLDDFSALRMAIGSISVEQRKAQRQEQKLIRRSEKRARKDLGQSTKYQRPTSAQTATTQEDDLINQMQRLMHEDESHILGVANPDDEEDHYSPHFSDDTTIVDEEENGRI